MLSQMIDKYLLSQEEEKRRVPSSHHPSSINDCTRKQYYRWKQTPVSNPISPGDLLKMRIGDGIHQLIHELLVAAKYEIINEIEFKVNFDLLKYPISGRIDNMFKDDNGELCGIEIKSSFGQGIINIMKKNEPKPEHMMQIITYLFCTDLKKFYLLYVARDKALKLEFVIEKKDGVVYLDKKEYMTMDKFKSIISKKLSAIEYFVETDKIPARDYKVAIKNGEIKEMFQRNNLKYKSDWPCFYCAWCDTCWKDELDKYKFTDNYEQIINNYTEGE